jgi:hypothetical protein
VCKKRKLGFSCGANQFAVHTSSIAESLVLLS